MDIQVLKSFISEIFLSICILSYLLFNVFLIKHNTKNNPLIDKENLFQCLFILSCCVLLCYKLEIEGELPSISLINNLGIKLLKLIILILSIIIIIPYWRYYVNDKLNFYEFFVLYLLIIIFNKTCHFNVIYLFT